MPIWLNNGFTQGFAHFDFNKVLVVFFVQYMKGVEMVKRAFLLSLALFLSFTTFSAQASNLGTLPADAPWVLEYAEKYDGAVLGNHLSIAHHPITGAAYVSYYDSLNKDLKLAYEVEPGNGNCGTDNRWLCETVDSTGNVGLYTSIDVVNVFTGLNSTESTLIGISYYDTTNDAIKYAKGTNNGTSTQWEFSQVDNVDYVLYTSLRFGLNTTPYIAYHAMKVTSPPSGSVKLAWYDETGGGNCGTSNLWICETVDLKSSIDHGIHVSLDLLYDGTPAIAFYNDETDALELAVKQAGSGCSNSAWTCTIVDGSAEDVGLFPSLQAPKSVNSRYRIAYYDATNDLLKYAESVISGGNCTSSLFNCYSVDSVGFSDILNTYDLSMDLDNQGYPIIAYQDATTSAPKIKIARPAQVYGETSGNCGTPTNQWQCDVIDPGSGFDLEGKYMAVSISPIGSATIAYTELDTRPIEPNTYLKIARQELFCVNLPFVVR